MARGGACRKAKKVAGEAREEQRVVKKRLMEMVAQVAREAREERRRGLRTKKKANKAKRENMRWRHRT
jgi:hypothetical protein